MSNTTLYKFRYFLEQVGSLMMVEKVLKRTELLPRMDQKIDEVLARVGVIDENLTDSLRMSGSAINKNISRSLNQGSCQE